VVIRHQFLGNRSINSTSTPENTSTEMSSNDAMNCCTSEYEATRLSDENGEVILEEDFETTHVEKQDVATITNQCAYVQKLL
jgi:hypothetical protein